MKGKEGRKGPGTLVRRQNSIAAAFLPLNRRLNAANSRTPFEKEASLGPSAASDTDPSSFEGVGLRTDLVRQPAASRIGDVTDPCAGRKLSTQTGPAWKKQVVSRVCHSQESRGFGLCDNKRCNPDATAGEGPSLSVPDLRQHILLNNPDTLLSSPAPSGARFDEVACSVSKASTSLPSVLPLSTVGILELSPSDKRILFQPGPDQDW